MDGWMGITCKTYSLMQPPLSCFSHWMSWKVLLLSCDECQKWACMHRVLSACGNQKVVLQGECTLSGKVVAFTSAQNSVCGTVMDTDVLLSTPRHDKLRLLVVFHFFTFYHYPPTVTPTVLAKTRHCASQIPFPVVAAFSIETTCAIFQCTLNGPWCRV